MSRITYIEPKEDYCLLVVLENGSSILLNLESRIGTIRFKRLADPEFFRTAVTDGDSIRWGDEIEISVNEAFLLTQK
jgi:Protein of unknown function (DUF2442).